MSSYRSLNQDQSEIRLVRFVSGPQTEPYDFYSTPISLQLGHSSLKGINAPYSALSYAWGDATDCREIYVDGHGFRIGRNLRDALRQLRHTGVSSWLWIDSICIQQLDVEEKTWQVGLMGEIYSRAERVYMWLGLGFELENLAMDFACRVGPRALSCGSFDLVARYLWSHEKLFQLVQAQSRHDVDNSGEDSAEVELARFLLDLSKEKGLWSKDKENSGPRGSILEGLQLIMTREYWHRIWIIQEVALGHGAVLMCGDRIIPIDEFDAVSKAIGFCTRLSSNHTPWNDGRFFGHGLDLDVFDKLPLIARRFHQRGTVEEPIRLVHFLIRRTSQMSPSYASTDPRDIVFGLLGVVPEKQRLGLVADYRLTACEVFCQLTMALYRDNNRSGFNLDSCHPEQYLATDPNLPSWVPDWAVVGKRGLLEHPINYCGNYHASDSWPVQDPSKWPDDSGNVPLNVLHGQGHVIDIITEVMDQPRLISHGWAGHSPLKEAEAWLGSVMQFTQLGLESGPAEDYIWRTFLCRERVFQNPGRFSDHPPSKHEELYWIIRRIMRGEPIESISLTETQSEFIKKGIHDFATYHPDLQALEDMFAWLRKYILVLAAGFLRQRTFFKTSKNMLGLAHLPIRQGDIVVLLYGVPSPIVLRPLKRAEESGFTFLGDAYVDGIMRGEFLKTEPALTDFYIH